ncbi:MAG: glycerophosphodiester phosphodiesterase family protein [Candidatus Hydrogenedentes bacterium]|nr:glycerophosphodiester phosphodiesterase family protein [Candidatus Hydrogenedentota bacterium]
MATVLIVLLAAVFHADGESATHMAFFAQPIRLAAHRGGATLWPENTALAYRNAAATWPGVLLDGDALCTADGHIVLLHDSTVDRTTNGTGRIADLTLAQVKALDAGYRFTHNDGATYPYRGQGVTIPTFAEALAAAPGSRFLIEIKNQSNVPAAILKDIAEANAFDRVILASFNPMLIAQVRALNPNALTCYDILEGTDLFVRLRSGRWTDYRPQADMLAIADDFIEDFHIQPSELHAIQAKGIPILVHTVNAPDAMRTFLAEGVDSILTDYPERLAAILEEKP